MTLSIRSYSFWGFGHIFFHPVDHIRLIFLRVNFNNFCCFRLCMPAWPSRAARTARLMHSVTRPVVTSLWCVSTLLKLSNSQQYVCCNAVLNQSNNKIVSYRCLPHPTIVKYVRSLITPINEGVKSLVRQPPDLLDLFPRPCSSNN